jgi:hypothetical protein
MIEIICSVIVLAFAGFYLAPRAPWHLSRAELPRYHRLSEKIHRNEIHPYE